MVVFEFIVFDLVVGWVNYVCLFVDEKFYELVFEIGDESIRL